MKSLAIVVMFAFVVIALEAAKIPKVRDVPADVPEEGLGALDEIPVKRLPRPCKDDGEECKGSNDCCGGNCIHKGIFFGKSVNKCE